MPHINTLNHTLRRVARQRGLSVARDREFWQLIAKEYEHALLSAGIDPDVESPFTADDRPVAGTGTFIAFVNAGQWVAQCPDCGEIGLIRHRNTLHMCIGCWHGSTPQWLELTWPAEWQEIERILLFRPRYENRNWLSSETLDDLRQQNRDNGLPTGE